MKKDPKYLGIPNINFSLTSSDDKREKEYAKQRIERGFDNSEMWSLANTIASFIIPRLKHFKVTQNGTPYNFRSDKKWRLTLEKMIVAFELIERDNGSWIFNEKEHIELKQGLILFSENILNLWD